MKMRAYMALSCKVGAFDRVLDELMKLRHLRTHAQRECARYFLLFGPVDILVQFTGLKDMDEFVRNWFTPIRMITADEPLIEKIQLG